MFHWGNRFRTVIWTTFESELNHKFSFFDDKLIRLKKIRKLRLRGEHKISNEIEEPKKFFCSFSCPSSWKDGTEMNIFSFKLFTLELLIEDKLNINKAFVGYVQADGHDVEYCQLLSPKIGRHWKRDETSVRRLF